MLGYYCVQCGIHSWNVPDNYGHSLHCQACVTHLEQDRWRGRLAQVAYGSVWFQLGGFTDAVVDCLAGDLDLIPRDRRRHALLVFLAPHGLLWQFRLEEDSSDYSPVEYRRNLLEKIIAFLA